MVDDKSGSRTHNASIIAHHRTIYIKHFKLYNYCMHMFDPRVHTPEALTAELAALEAYNPDSRIVGSLGRAVLLNEAQGDPTLEYRTRGARPLHDPTDPSGNRKVRDIDALNVPHLNGFEQVFPIDSLSGTSPQAAVVRTEGGWRLQSTDSGFDEPLDSAVMSLVHGETVFSIPVQTVRAQAHRALLEVRATEYDKDHLAAALLADLIADDEKPLPEYLFDPFRALMRLQQRGPQPMINRHFRIPHWHDQRTA